MPDASGNDYEDTDRIVIDRVTTADKLRPMRVPRLFRVALLGLISACSRGDRAASSGVSGAAGDSAGVRRTNVDWIPGTNPLILVPAHSSDRAAI